MSVKEEKGREGKEKGRRRKEKGKESEGKSKRTVSEGKGKEEETRARVRMIGARSADARRLHASSYCCYLCLVPSPLYPA